MCGKPREVCFAREVSFGREVFAIANEKCQAVLDEKDRKIKVKDLAEREA